MITAIDTNVLLDMLVPGAAGATAARDLLDRVDREGALVVSEVVFAELGGQFPAAEELASFLEATGIRLVPSSEPALHRSGEAWRTFLRKRKPGRLACPRCGRAQRVVCRDCKSPIGVRQHLLADFLIGGHAAVHADRLASRDRGYFATYFPEVEVIAPA